MGSDQNSAFWCNMWHILLWWQTDGGVCGYKRGVLGAIELLRLAFVDGAEVPSNRLWPSACLAFRQRQLGGHSLVSVETLWVALMVAARPDVRDMMAFFLQSPLAAPSSLTARRLWRLWRLWRLCFLQPSGPTWTDLNLQIWDKMAVLLTATRNWNFEFAGKWRLYFLQPPDLDLQIWQKMVAPLTATWNFEFDGKLAALAALVALLLQPLN